MKLSEFMEKEGFKTTENIMVELPLESVEIIDNTVILAFKDLYGKICLHINKSKEIDVYDGNEDAIKYLNPYVEDNRDTIDVESLKKYLKDFMERENRVEGSRIKPSYYLLPNGIECFDVVRHFCYNTGTAIAYLWRAGRKTEEGMDNTDKAIEDMEKAVVHIQDQINELKRQRNK